ncbi:MAG: S8 family serine peptidase, partial [Clostridia bacterium]|nr:S8 family serine peptidase [Clostridia bacterium]
MTKLRKISLVLTSMILAASIAAVSVSVSFAAGGKKALNNAVRADVTKLNTPVDTRTQSFFDENVVSKLPADLSGESEISLIVSLGGNTVIDNYNVRGEGSLGEYLSSAEANALSGSVSARSDAAIRKLRSAGIKFTEGERYDKLLNGFEITVKSKYYNDVAKVLGKDVTLIIGETYLEEATTEIITNEVDVYETGIFDSHLSEYQGDGVLIAVLDTGLDYTHTAFSDDNFTTSNEAFTRSVVASKISGTEAAKFTAGLSVADVYRGRKVPFAYDYADKDTDVFPINSEHGTHVAGIIAGKNDKITGVAPNAQLAIMKVFSDYREGAKTSWILAGLEDCVNLGVDVINMSLGTACGFAREEDKEEVNRVYDRIKGAGISLIVAAGNDYSATFGSEKNGRNPLTRNPDSGVVGSPSTYSAALSVASVEGVKTPYFRFNDGIMYFEEANDSSGKPKSFVDEILATVGSGVTEHTFDYVTIPGIGRSSDYLEDDYSGKIVLVKRGQTTFEDKVRIALVEKKAAGVIIYNNVSGSIIMTIGKSRGAVCSITQEDGEAMAAFGTGKITVSKSQLAGPFMSDFSSWGPTSDLQRKPEITAHGGQIYSAIPGESYDRLSGTSMACPNQAGAAALIRQFVKSNENLGKDKTTQEVTALVNQIMMSTADVIKNKNGLPAAVRKQGAGLINISKAVSTAAYITSYDKNGNKMDKSKFELGDDKDEKGVYEMTFDVTNFIDKAVSYEITASVLSEGVSAVYTPHGDRVSTEEGYVLGGKLDVLSVNGSAASGNTVTVSAGQTVKISVRITLTEADKKYLKDSFENGIYVEGFVNLRAVSGTTVNINAPFLAFFGDWTKAPVFDEEYYDTNADELNDGIDDEDKLMPDAYSTRVIGKLYSDYIATLGSYVFTQDPDAVKISADKNKIAISNRLDDENSTVNSVEYIWAGLLRNVKEADITITEDATGKVVFTRTEKNQRKSYSAGNSIYPSSIDVEFSAIENNLKNNTRYTVTVDAYIDYGEKSEQNNVKSRFEFPLYIDFEAPTITDVEYYTEYDKATKKTSLFARLYVYDNHYPMGVSVGQLVENEDRDSRYELAMRSFFKYVTPIFNPSFNSVSTVTVDLTDHIAEIKQSLGTAYNPNGTSYVENRNTFIATCYDYALNAATFELRLPDDILSLCFKEDALELRTGEIVDMASVLAVYPTDSWIATLDFISDNDDIVSVVNGTLIAKSEGTARIRVKGYTAALEVTVLGGGGYTIPEVNSFTVTSYTTNNAFYLDSSRDIGEEGYTYNFDGEYELKMYPSESVTLNCKVDSYFSDKSVSFSVRNSRIAKVDENGTITALEEGVTAVVATAKVNGKNTNSTVRISIEVKDPYEIN